MVMPCGMSGGELAKILQSRNPQLKVIYTSGYSPEILRKDSLLTQGINFLPKPYDLQTLLKAVRTCLDGGKLPHRGETRGAQAGKRARPGCRQPDSRPAAPGSLQREKAAGAEPAVWSEQKSLQPLSPMASTGQPSLASLQRASSSGFAGCLYTNE